MALIRTIQEVHDTKLKISSLDEDASLPDIDEAQRLYILPHLGAALIAQCEAAADAPSNPFNDAEIADALVLLPYVQKPLAAFAYWNDMAAMHSRITDAGIRRTTTDNMPAAYKWEYEEATNYLEERAYSTLEALLVWLEANKTNYPNYTSSDAYTARQAQIFKDGREFNNYYTLHQPHRTFYYLLPLQHEAELLYVVPLIGEDFFTSLKTDATPDADTLQALVLLKYALANLTVHLAAKKLPCRFGADGFDVRQSTGNNTSERAAATDKQMGSMGQAAEVHGTKYLNQLRDMLNIKASETVFADYFSGEKYKAPGTKIIDRQNGLRKIFRF